MARLIPQNSVDLRTGLIINYQGTLIFYPCSKESQQGFLGKGLQGEVMTTFSFDGEFKIHLFGDFETPPGYSCKVSRHGLKEMTLHGEEALKLARKIFSMKTLSYRSSWGRGRVVNLGELF